MRVDQKRTATAFFFKTAALTCIMTNTGKRPHIMHCPNNRLSQIGQFFYIRNRQKSLINPMQMNNVRFLYLFKFRNIRTGVSYRNRKEITPRKTVIKANNKPLPCKTDKIKHPSKSRKRNGRNISIYAAIRNPYQ